MAKLVYELIHESSQNVPGNKAIISGEHSLNYQQLSNTANEVASSFLTLGLRKQERVAIYLPKSIENVLSMFAATQAGGVFVPINPLLKAPQARHILADCNVRILVTNINRLKAIKDEIEKCNELSTIIIIDDGTSGAPKINSKHIICWAEFIGLAKQMISYQIVDSDMAAIFYTSGSTGNPKGVVLSHRNIVCGAESVVEYLQNSSSDKLLAMLPLSFDYGFSQLSTAFKSGACVVLLDYLLPKDVLNAIEKNSITGLAGIPPLWVQLVKLKWAEKAKESLRYITNSGGVMPRATLSKLIAILPDTQIYLMYGLTEAFRSTYLPPDQVHIRPTSIGRAIPNACVDVVRKDSSICGPHEAGELVHRGSLVSLGYWNNPEKTALRFKTASGQENRLITEEIAVWSGDTVKMDDEGYLYFIGRKDDMIKTSGYRVSPTEVEEVIYATNLVTEACVVGIPHRSLGQAIVVVATPKNNGPKYDNEILNFCRQKLPNFMMPSKIVWRNKLPINPNGKFDRNCIISDLEKLHADIE